MAVKIEFYVYRIFDGPTTVYVGKGSGRRLQSQQYAFHLPGEIVEHCKSDDHAFQRERHWISILQPTENISAGGNGGRAKKKRVWVGRTKLDVAMRKYGTRYGSAMVLLTFLDERNCEQYGVPKENIQIFRDYIANAKPIGLAA